MRAPRNQSADQQGTLPGFLARMWWMFFGDILLAFALIFGDPTARRPQPGPPSGCRPDQCQLGQNRRDRRPCPSPSGPPPRSPRPVPPAPMGSASGVIERRPYQERSGDGDGHARNRRIGPPPRRRTHRRQSVSTRRNPAAQIPLFVAACSRCVARTTGLGTILVTTGRFSSVGVVGARKRRPRPIMPRPASR